MALSTACGMHGGLFGYGWIFQIIIFILFFVVVWWLIRTQGTTSRAKAGETPSEILKRRLAAGEITKKQYDDLKKDLEI